ncbi:MAG: nitrophenyl compound nitroreductase subunit ArsF family protein [Fibrobacterota bacterium]
MSRFFDKIPTKLAVLCAVLIMVNPACAEKRGETEDAQSISQNKDETAKTISAAKSEETESAVDVYLFHGSYRCRSCNLMEELTLEVIDERLAREKKNGSVRFSHVNVEKDENRHFIDKYKISSISIIVSKKSGGKETKWKNLDKVWTLLGNNEKFKEYVLAEIETYLEVKGE